MSNLVLRVLWLDKSLALAVDQKIGEKTQPLTEYFFWPRNDAWEEIKKQLNENSWIPPSETILVVNRMTDIIHCWQAEEKEPMKAMQEKFEDCLFVGMN